ncbi:MAG: tetraacyldisaccharide 4'-kinase [Parabacteroides sp.]|nr:tetraacyldisaccharide 4'-kinase [Parabacteroides sp.]
MPTENNIKIHPLLAPLSFLYGIEVRLCNQLFDWKILPSESYPVPIISIGNLAVGGTGKTPHTEYIIRLLKSKYKVAVLSRGYKRKTSGFILADKRSTSLDIGDEPYQMKRKFPDILVAVDADRRQGISKLLALPEGQRPEIILLDDAFQHRYVTPSLSIVLTDYHRLFYNDKLLPVGQLREPICGIRRSDMVIVTKCEEDMKPIEYRIIEENMKLLAHQSIHFTHIAYGEIEPVFASKAKPLSRNNIQKEDDLLALSGITSPNGFIKEARKLSNKVVPLTFPDHHAFNKSDIRRIKNIFDNMASSGKRILTTEKDASRLFDNPHIPEEWKMCMYYLPITIEFCLDKNFDDEICKHVIAFNKDKFLR